MSESKSVLDEIIQYEKNQSVQETDSQVNPEQTSQVKAEQENQEVAPEVTPETEATTKPEAKKKVGRPTKEEAEAKAKSTEPKRFWEEDEEEGEAASEEAKVDYKALYEDSVSRLKRYEDKPVLASLAEAMESPEFDADKFFDSYKPKELKELSLEELWKLKTKSQSEVELDENDLNELWEEYEIELGESNAKKKMAKDSLIKELRPKVDLGKEPEYVTKLKDEAKNRKESESRANEAYQEMIDSSLSYADSLLDKPIIGDLKVTAEDVELIKQSLNPSSGYYTKNGKFDTKKMVREKMFAIKFTAILAEAEKSAKMDAKKEVHRPNLNSVGGDNMAPDGDSEDVKTMKAIGLIK